MKGGSKPKGGKKPKGGGSRRGAESSTKAGRKSRRAKKPQLRGNAVNFNSHGGLKWHSELSKKLSEKCQNAFCSEVVLGLSNFFAALSSNHDQCRPFL